MKDYKELFLEEIMYQSAVFVAEIGVLANERGDVGLARKFLGLVIFCVDPKERKKADLDSNYEPEVSCSEEKALEILKEVAKAKSLSEIKAILNEKLGN